ncbi:MAG: DNA-formamidopyrimidine glycosylase [Rhizobiales bacterium 24-66-13]|jgi:formamidopyrimidine-DNA glycosylase|uniref:bifunctional DNA-formamidopyrimidine glycosylase/DNA-(apurinic or apyrimidinic site) lyase n=1 Tax=Roseixanthobacter finlandensis TaxID=3119922 RepID=UPI000BC82062|nr:MAG: DNA-formamidopyrimidine glycosylase [Rhizobiales bacterium 12-66-7]OYZ69012.1 MAG: DNA-formamidopyrimidine glycosylase [Rhizobiales bacterium 24-66-13]OZB06086.1 MAG: DNA-formamidopyrimidine glycosylase [Rhizobiales bacterium 39-66-18]HQS09967.1 bifunctional DNA-formamidopyrimidine glycosylase/DNA-(apurinic or apyrimidinic site) lyase [Xanthobacteraceae bacterium]HQS47930.1 bifunctional DNA-formamidopyrimidine glycosylase/DNA-(apurinic or apyrimidinic site) lyase [Xanthobacteraceae bact
MPELPEVETVRRGLMPVLQGAVIESVEARRPDLRWPLPDSFAERLAGRRVEAVGRRAKYLLADLDGGEVLVVHLGMSGSIRIEGGPNVRRPGGFHYPRGEAGPHDHVVLHLSSGATVTFNDPRRFGAMLLVPYDRLESHPLLRNLGPEPLGNFFHATHLARVCAGRRSNLKATLLDQKIVSGLGNIYVCEALHRAHLSPRRLASTLATKAGGPTVRGERLVTAIRDVLREAIQAGGSSLRDHRQVNGELGYFQHAFRVYDREGEPCPTRHCKGTVQRMVQGARSTFFCPSCQR